LELEYLQYTSIKVT